MATLKQAKRVFKGTGGQMWWNGKLLCEVQSCTAKLKYNYEKVYLNGQLITGRKMTSVDGTLSFKYYHVDAELAKEAAAAIAANKQLEGTVISSLSDPDAAGTIRMSFDGVTLDELPLLDWARGKLSEGTVNAAFESFELLDAPEAT